MKQLYIISIMIITIIFSFLIIPVSYSAPPKCLLDEFEIPIVSHNPALSFDAKGAYLYYLTETGLTSNTDKNLTEYTNSVYTLSALRLPELSNITICELEKLYFL